MENHGILKKLITYELYIFDNLAVTKQGKSITWGYDSLSAGCRCPVVQLLLIYWRKMLRKKKIYEKNTKIQDGVGTVVQYTYKKYIRL